jgi:hypothetical protein
MSVSLAGNRIRVTNTRVSVPCSCSVHSAIFLSLQSQPTAAKVGSMKAEFSGADGQRSAAFDRQSVLIGRIGGCTHRCAMRASRICWRFPRVLEVRQRQCLSLQRACQLAVFSGKLPSMEVEIDCKLQSNSS